MALLEVENLTIRFAASRREADVAAVTGLSFALEPGQCLAIVGESGSGKSTAARALVGLAGPTAHVSADKMRLGACELLDLSPRQWRALRGRHIGFVLQDALVSLDPLRRIGDEVGEALHEHRILTRREIPKRVEALLQAVGIADPQRRARQYAHQLSGGLRQRALIASALAADPSIIIADEPTTALDVIVQKQILALLARLKAEGRGLILISHDLAVVAELADHIIVLKDGQIVERGPRREILANPQADYTRMLLDAVPNRRSRRGTPAPRPEKTTPEQSPPQQNPPEQNPPEQSPPGTIQPAKIQPQPIVEAHDLSLRLGKSSVVRGVSLKIRQGETLGLVGASGSGKSSLARLLLGLTRPDTGTVRLKGEDWSGLSEARRRPLRRKVQLVAQDPLSAFDPRYRVSQILAEAMDRTDTEEILALLASVGLDPSHIHRFPRELSGGQRQRVAIARAIACKPDLLICDEPVSALDVATQAQVLALLNKLRRDFGLAMLFISHDLGVIRQISDRVMVMNEGEIVEAGDPAQIFDTPSHAFTKSLIAALPALPERTGPERTGREPFCQAPDPR